MKNKAKNPSLSSEETDKYAKLVLKETHILLSRGWTTAADARNKHGDPLPFDHDNAVAFSLKGALLRVLMEYVPWGYRTYMWQHVRSMLAQQLHIPSHGNSINAWNDSHAKGQKGKGEVLEAVKDVQNILRNKPKATTTTGVPKKVLNDLFSSKLTVVEGKTKGKPIKLNGKYLKKQLQEVSFARKIVPPEQVAPEPKRTPNTDMLFLKEYARGHLKSAPRDLDTLGVLTLAQRFRLFMCLGLDLIEKDNDIAFLKASADQQALILAVALMGYDVGLFVKD